MLDEVRRGLLNISLKWGEGLDRNGRPYGWMIDTRELLLQGDYLSTTCRLLWERLKKYEPDFVAGMTLAANPLVLGLMYAAREEGRSLNGSIIRRQAKADGLQKLVEGPPIPAGARVVIVDDLINAGDTQQQALRALEPFDCEVVAVGVMIDYERQGAAWLAQRQIPVESLFTLAGLGVARAQARGDRICPEWTFPGLNRGEYDAPKSRPALQGERIYVGSDEGFLLCLDLQGQEVFRFWVQDRERGIHSSPLVHQGRCYFGSYDGGLYCLDAGSGEQIWKTRPAQWIGSSPVLGEGLLYIGVEFGQSGGSLLAVDPDTGRRRWECPATDYVHASPCYVAETQGVLFGSNDGSLRCADARSGRLRWQFASQGAIKAAPVVDPQGRCLFTSFDGNLYCLDCQDGKLLWKRRLSHRLYWEPLLWEELVVIGGYSARVAALDRASGEIVWVAAASGSLIGGGCIISGDRVAVGDLEGQVSLFSARQGQLLGEFPTGGPIRTTPVWRDRLYLPSCDGRLYAFQVR